MKQDNCKKQEGNEGNDKKNCKHYCDSNNNND